MNFHILTLFPEMVMNGLNTSIIGRAVNAGHLSIEAVDIRDYAFNKHQSVDDYPYGGGAGMLMQAEPVYLAHKAVAEAIQSRMSGRMQDETPEKTQAEAFEEAQAEAFKEAQAVAPGEAQAEVFEEAQAVAPGEAQTETPEEAQTVTPEEAQTAGEGENSPAGRRIRTVYLSPQGRVFDQKMAEELAQEEDLILLCGHYEGIDERVLEEIVTDYVSIGDYVLTGGELPAMVMVDAISRLVPGVLHNDVSAEFESFQDNLLEYPQYSRPEEWHGKKVPPVLLSGHHANIEKWRREQSIIRTYERRPDLLEKCELTEKEKKWFREWLEGKFEK